MRFQGLVAAICLTGSVSAATIVVPAGATDVERAAADELRIAAEKMTGRQWPVVTEGSGLPEKPCYLIGRTKAAGDRPFALDEIHVRPVDGGVVLTGEATRGPLYAVIDYLEHECGVRWWTSTESHFPKLAILPLPTAERRHVPTFKYREVYYRDALDSDFKVHLRSNFASRTSLMNSDQHDIPPEKGGSYRFPVFPGRLSAYHTMFVFVPPDKYFPDHPEWFSLVDGKRVPKQLCLTNPEMESVFTESVIEALRRDPDAKFIQVSQMDNSSPCECASCRAVEAEEGGAHAAPLLRFVNRVAEEVERVRPDVRIDTFAYKYTRRAPTRTRPRSNVVVRLCDIECAFNRTHEEQPDSGFARDLMDWSRLAEGRLFVWTYTTNFSGYMLPHPNYHVQAPNLRFFAKSGAVGVFEQGDVQCSAGEFAPLRTWVLAHLNWDATADEKKLEEEFLTGYYGPAAPHLRRYLDVLCETGRRAASGKIGCYHKTDSWMTLSDMLSLDAAMTAAVAAADRAGAPWRRRVRRERISLDNLWISRWDDWKAEASAGRDVWTKGSYADFACRWICDCASYGVLSFRECGPFGFCEYAERIMNRIDGIEQEEEVSK